MMLSRRAQVLPSGLFVNFLHRGRYRLDTVFWMCPITTLELTLTAVVRQVQLTMFQLHINDVHNRLALFRAVTRIHVDMLRDEARRTMVAVPITFNRRSTIITHKIFFVAGELLFL